MTVILIIIAAMFIIVLFVTGALLSVWDKGSKLLATILAIAPVLAGISAAIATWLLLAKR